MWGSVLAGWLGCARPELVQIVVVARWDGAGSAQIETELGLPLEEALGSLPGARGLIVWSHTGRAQLQVSVPSSSAEQLADALDRVILPQDVHPWAYRAPEHTSDWLVPVAQARELLPELDREFGLDSAWSDTLPVEVTEVYLPAGTDLQALLAELPERLPGGVPELLRARATQVRSVGSRVSAAWDGAPVAVLHVRRPAGEVERWLSARQVHATPVPSERAVHLQAWDRPAEALVQRVKELGAEHVLVISGRPLPAGEPEPGRVEVVAQWPAQVPALDLPGVQISPLPAVRSIVTGPEPVLRALELPPRTIWDVEIDAERARALAMEPRTIAGALLLATSGQRLPTEDGSVIELKLGEGKLELEALSELVVGERQGAQVRVGDVAKLVAVEEPRERIRADRQPAAITTGALPEGAVLLSREPVVRYPW
jgi:hypothetical protein